MKAVIMAGGEGTRLRPLTCGRPKPMVPVANRPVMQHIIELLKKHGIADVAVTLQYMPELISEYFNDGSDFGMRMRYYIEKAPLGTAGSVKNAEDFLDDTFIVISGDALTDIDLTKAVQFHEENAAIATLVLKRVDVPLEYGVVVTDRQGRITNFIEKPGWSEVFSDTVNTGIYILSPEIFKYYKKNEVFDFSKDLFPLLMNENRPLYGFITDDYWCDVGDVNAYIQAHEDILNGHVNVNIRGVEISKGVWVEEGTRIDTSVTIVPPCTIGRNCRLRGNAVIGGYSVIGDNTIIEGNSGIKRSIIWRNSVLENNVQLRGCVISEKVHLRDNVSAFEGSVIGDGTVVRDNAIIKPDVRIWPGKLIEQGTEVSANIVWGSKLKRTIFGNRGISGEINVDITPEYATRLGAAFGSVKKPNARIGVCCDNTSTAEMISISLTAGLMSAGIEVHDMGRLLLPMTRSAVRFYRLDGGVHVSTSSEFNSKIVLDFIDHKGSNIDRATERKIENAFNRDDFNRCECEYITRVKEIRGYDEFYLKGIINNVKSENLDYRIALTSRSPYILKVFKKLLDELDCTTEEIHADYGVSYFTGHVRKGKFDLGVSIEDNSEKMMLVDDKGRLVTEDMFIALISLILFRTVQGGTVVVPVSASNVIDRLAELNKGKVVRTRTSQREIMNRMMGKGIKEEMLDQFTMHFDAIAGLIRILDFMKINDTSLAELIDMIPEIHMSKKQVECPWNAKGKVIRKIIQENETENEKIETTEGVKIHKKNGWVMVLPDSEQPFCRVIGESDSAEFAEELTGIYVNKIIEISRG